MNRWTILAAAAALSLSAAAMAGTSPSRHEGHGATQAAAEATYSGVGVVRKVDAAHGKVVLQHDAIDALGWPPMTMAFEVADARLLSGLAPGRKVRFAFVHQAAGYVITAID